MKTIAIDRVTVRERRQRKEFNEAELQELIESIANNGLFHPVCLRDENGEKILVSGERRLRAVNDLHTLGRSFLHDSQLVPLGEVPYVDLGDLSPLDRRIAELEENVNRAALTWQEQASATAEIEALRSELATQRGTSPPTVAEISEQMRGSSKGVHHETTRREIIVAKYLADPEVRAAASVDDAFKVLRRKEETARRVQLAATIGTTYDAGTAHKLLNTDALVWMKEAAPEQFDAICTDPPFGIGADEFGDSGGHTQGAHQYKDDYETWLSLITCLAQEGFRITKSQAHLYCFCDITHFEEAKAIFTVASWKVHRTPIVWHKPNGNRIPWVDQGPQRKYELVLYANKGKKPVTRIYPDLVTYAADENLGHNAQKPVALYTDLLRRSVGPGDAVLDPFAGSGPLLPAANELKCYATVIEKDPAAYAICVHRLDTLTEQPELEGLT